MHTFSRVCVYCGSSRGGPRYVEAARRMGAVLAERGVGLVYGGGHVGLMGVVADAVLEAGGEVIGVIPEQLVDLELAHRGLTRLIVTRGMHERKLTMADHADAFVALPGGFGTLEELFEATTWAQLNVHRKPVGVLDVDGYWEPIFAFLRRAVAEGFIQPIHRHLIVREATPEALLERLANTEIPDVGQWIDRI